MPDITQRFSIDVSGAIKALDVLDQRLERFNGTLDQIASTMGGFNSTVRKALDLGDAGNKLKLTGDAAAKAFDDFINSAEKASKTIPKVGEGASRASIAIARLKAVAAGSIAALKNLGKIGEKAFKGLFGSVSQLTRIIGTRVLIQGFGALQNAVKSSVSAAAELSKSIREVGTILPVTQRNSEALTASVRRLSDTFNLPIQAVTEGLYQTVSNQIGDAATSLGFLETAAKFAKTAVTSIDTSVNLLSGVLNAFGLESRDTEAVADKLFKTIELGRTRADELAQSLGRILPVSKELGLGLDEVLAGFATITIAGIKTSEATTQLRGALNALLKPTQATKDLLAELGFTSGEAFVQAKGLQGAFIALKEAAGGSITELSKFIPRVRGLNAALIFGADGSDKFQENLRKIREESEGLLQQNFEFVIEPDPEQVAKTVNRLTNLFTIELGTAILETLAKLTRFVGGLDNVGAALKTFGPILVVVGGGIAALVAGVIAYNTVAVIATGITKGLAVSMGALGVAAGAALIPLAIFAAASFAENRRVAQLKAELEAIKEVGRAELEFVKKQNAAAIALRGARTRELNAILQEEIAAFNIGFQKEVDAAKKANDEIIADQKRVVNAVISAGEEITQATKRRISEEQSIQKDSSNEIADTAQELSDFQFKTENKRFGQLQQFSNIQERANKQAQEAVRLARVASGSKATKEDIEAARAAFSRAQSTAQEAQSIAGQLGNKVAIRQVEQTIEGILKKKLDSEKKITQSSKARQTAAEKLLKTQQKELKNLKDLSKAVLDAPSLFDDDGNALAGKAQADALSARQTALTAFRNALANSETLSVDQIIDFSQFGKDIDKSLSQADIANLSINSEAFANLRLQINNNLKDFRATFGAVLETIEIAQDVEITNPGQLSTAIGAQAVVNQQTDQAAAGLKENLVEIKNAIPTIEAGLKSLGTLPGLATALRPVNLGFARLFDNERFGQFESELPKLATALVPFLTKLKEAGTLTDAEIKAVQQLQKDSAKLNLSQAPAGFQDRATAVAGVLGALTQAITAIQQVNVAEASGVNTEQAKKNAAFNKASEQSVGKEADNRRKAAEEARKVTTSSESISTTTGTTANNTGNIAADTTVAAANFRSMAADSAKINNSTGSTGATGARMGKFFPRFLADGGFASRGTDSIPAMLSPGEFVVNARSSKRFFSQLQAINAGKRPVFRQDGGPVTSVGDINVTVSGNKEDSTTGRQIARSIRRELRRGTSSL